MIYYSASETLKGIALALSFGALLNAISITLDIVFDFLKAFVHIPVDVTRFIESEENAIRYLKRTHPHKASQSNVMLIFKDIIFSCICGFLLSLLLYVTTDGEFRVYVLAVVFLSYVITKKACGTLIYKMIFGLIENLMKIVLSVIVFAALPIRFVTKKCFGRKRIKKQ